jgi:hypothetical protein
VLRVYLDQNKWIELARAAHGHRLGAPVQDVLDVARAAVAAGAVSFPLDVARYYETWKRGNFSSRQRLVETMLELSKLHSIAPSRVLLAHEIDTALQERFGGPAVPLPQVFGVGVNHACGGGLGAFHADLPPDLAPGLAAQIEAAFQQALEVGLLTGPPDLTNLSPELAQVMAQMSQDQQFASGATELTDRLRAMGYSKGMKLDLAIVGTELGDILEPLVRGLLKHRVDPVAFLSQSPEELMAFVRDLPTRSLTSALRRDKHSAEQTWEPNDLNDLVYLPVAAVHCDVVVTERQWVHRLNKADVTGRFGTVVFSDLRRLRNLLVVAAP